MQNRLLNLQPIIPKLASLFATYLQCKLLNSVYINKHSLDLSDGILSIDEVSSKLSCWQELEVKQMYLKPLFHQTTCLSIVLLASTADLYNIIQFHQNLIFIINVGPHCNILCN